MKFVSHLFFPSSDRSELLVNIQLPQNFSIFATSNAMAKLEKLLENNFDIVRWSSYVGRGAVRFYLPLDEAQPNPSYSQTVIVTLSHCHIVTLSHFHIVTLSQRILKHQNGYAGIYKKNLKLVIKYK